METWKDITGYEGLYQVSDWGNVKSLPKKWDLYRGGFASHNGITLKPIVRHGHLTVGLVKEKKQRSFFIHRLVCDAFIENKENKPYVNHINCIKTDNRVENLEWCTSKENAEHALKMGRYPTKSRHHASVVVVDDQTGIFYETIGEAAKAKNMNYFTLNNMLSGHRRNKTSLRVA